MPNSSRVPVSWPHRATSDGLLDEHTTTWKGRIRALVCHVMEVFKSNLQSYNLHNGRRSGRIIGVDLSTEVMRELGDRITGGEAWGDRSGRCHASLRHAGDQRVAGEPER